MRKLQRVLRWVLTIFMLISGFVFFPSLASVLCWLFAVLAAPIKPLQRFWEYQVKLRGAAKVLIMVALFIGAVMTAPTDTVPVGPSANVQQQESQNSTEDVQEAPETPQDASEAQDVSEDVQVSAGEQEPAQPAQEAGETVQEPQEQPQANEPESEPQEADPQASEPDPAPAVTPEPEPEPQPEPAPQQNQTNSRAVYITPTGKRYHYDNNCNGGTYIPSTLAEAQAMGLTPCKKCAGG
ncbi:MAG TPA: hypothetical protein H9787_11355 [Candidatus Oscillibacter excrementigallinarum]|uniref:Ada DNA repair metal-binding domain-containing protein n=1 Tax=Candidatus Oscillibacter excrementigallinarum TaxID=2838716 RepID=A0A9D2RSP9_9FIRM|nr:hypothetical protein [Candidatus Oscillibacter excrementigallinarum]